eukprot:scaffold26360_cov60-Phaeocystis_antarctica.AAC.4
MVLFDGPKAVSPVEDVMMARGNRQTWLRFLAATCDLWRQQAFRTESTRVGALVSHCHSQQARLGKHLPDRFEAGCTGLSEYRAGHGQCRAAGFAACPRAAVHTGRCVQCGEGLRRIRSCTRKYGSWVWPFSARARRSGVLLLRRKHNDKIGDEERMTPTPTWTVRVADPVAVCED